MKSLPAAPAPNPGAGLSANLSVRPATQADAKAIAMLVRELGYSADAQTVRERLSRILGRSDHLVAVAQIGAGLIGGWVQAHSSEALESGFRVEIVGLVTAESMRRAGVGRLLVGHAESWAAHIGAPVVVVRSNIKRQESHAFYLALGYAMTKTQHVYRKHFLPGTARNIP